MNRLNKTEAATISILPCWAFFRDSDFFPDLSVLASKILQFLEKSTRQNIRARKDDMYRRRENKKGHKSVTTIA
jgi:hypothetical protein